MKRVPASNICKQKSADDKFGKILQNNSDNLKSSFLPGFFCLNLTVPSQKCSLFNILVDVDCKFLRCSFFAMCRGDRD